MKNVGLVGPRKNSFVESTDAVYAEIIKNPPPLPVRSYVISDSYATVDETKTSGHFELVNTGTPVRMASPARDSCISMPPGDFQANSVMSLISPSPPPPPLPPHHENTLAKLTVPPNRRDFPTLKNNPLYSSADDLGPTAPILPSRRFSSMSSGLEEGHLNIYAVPDRVPPPLPPFNEDSATPLYSEATLTPAAFQENAKVESPTGNVICPYASIYADPKPLLKEEGPIEVRPSHIKEVRPLGTGQFGQVALAETVGLSLKDLRLSDTDTNRKVKILVAVKRLKPDADKFVKEAFEKEIKFMARLNHMNVIRLLGICPIENSFILMEYMEHGDLNQYICKYELAPSDAAPAESQLPSAILLYMCVQIANGMRYLASLHFVHRDLATRNCLVGQNNTIKIADFGMSRSLYSSHYYRIKGRALLPIRWMANECFYGRFSEKTDVWAFGVTMWEIFMFGKEQPYISMTDQEVIENMVNVEEMKLLPKPESCPPEVYEIMLQCWEKDAEKRINFEDAHDSLSALHSYGDL